ncbi:MAG: DNA repair protein RecO [Pseudomonadota bacterium]
MMMQQFEFHKAVILHTRAYRETSLIVEFFTEKLGRITAVAKGAKRAKSPFRGILQPFVPLQIQFSGRRELQTLRDAQIHGELLKLQGPALLSSLYLNELLLKLLAKEDPHPELFIAYQITLTALSQSQSIEVNLRCFELQLLKELGYELQLEYCQNQPVQAECYYHYQYDKGLLAADLTQAAETKAYPFLGANLLALAKQKFSNRSQLQDAKHLLRYVISQILGHKIINSRALFE